MMTIQPGEGFSIVAYEGMIERLGPLRHFRDGASLAYLRIKEDDGEVHVLERVAVGFRIASYLEEGKRCRLFAVRWADKASPILPFAAEVNNQRVYDRAEIDRLSHGLRRAVLRTWGAIGLGSVVLILTVLLVYVGIPLFLWAMWRMKKGLRRAKLPMLEMESALRNSGWQLAIP